MISYTYFAAGNPARPTALKLISLSSFLTEQSKQKSEIRSFVTYCIALFDLFKAAKNALPASISYFETLLQNDDWFDAVATVSLDKKSPDCVADFLSKAPENSTVEHSACMFVAALYGEFCVAAPQESQPAASVATV